MINGLDDDDFYALYPGEVPKPRRRWRTGKMATMTTPTMNVELAPEGTAQAVLEVIVKLQEDNKKLISEVDSLRDRLCQAWHDQGLYISRAEAAEMQLKTLRANISKLVTP